MKKTKHKLPAFAAKAEKALQEAVRDTMIDHKRTGDPVAVWKNGRVVWIPAVKISVKAPSKRKKI